MNPFQQVIQKNQAWLCLDCGKCSSVCPITIHHLDRYTSPRLLVETAINVGEDAVLDDPLLWSCITCGRCSEICPSQVEFSSLIQESREIARDQELTGDCTHSGMIQTWGRMMVDPGLLQNRLNWISDDLRTDPDSETIYFPGCLPYYHEAFSSLGIDCYGMAKAALKILNHIGIEPLLLQNERCCGHDQFWQGEMDTFRKLAELNLDMIGNSKAKTIVTSCPECAYTLQHTYREEIGDHGLEVLHLVELLEKTEYIDHFDLDIITTNGRVTYQDPCRLGRYAGIYQQPRDLIKQAGYDLVEMEHNRRSSICCGTSCWSSCGQTNKMIQSERLQEARLTGANTLITACVKCQIHLKCAQLDPQGNGDGLEIRDLTTILANGIKD